VPPSASAATVPLADIDTPAATQPSAGLAPSSVLIEDVRPRVDCGRYPVKREVGDVLEVSADIFKDGHDKLAAVVRYGRRHDAADDWREAEMRFVDNDRWAASFPLTENTRYRYQVVAFPDKFATWRDGLEKKHAAGQDVALELQEGRVLLAEALSRAAGADRETLAAAIGVVDAGGSRAAAMGVVEAHRSRLAAVGGVVGDASPTAQVQHLLDEELAAAMRRARSRAGAAASPVYEVTVDRVKARFAAWYSFFPRSAGTEPGRSATFAEAAERLPAIAAMGFDTAYLLPIHPIGSTFRKGPNNTLGGGPDDPGVPYAIGSDDGGHDAIDPALGTLADFRAFRERAESLGIEVALDLAIQASPDHPWVSEHPEWFTVRPDGSIQYAENPPKKYQDIYPINFDSTDWRGLWDELLRVVLFWVEQGVKVFRVDNPHTKPTVFWEWLIGEVQQTHPEVIFLSEAFTRPKVMKTLAKAGFAQSYTYFTWRNFKREIREYFEELTQSEAVEYMRGNLFSNTHDILPIILQEGGRPAFRMRLALATTLSSVYGIYSGFELCENTPVPGKEEYLHSEKYEFKVWDWERPGNIIEDVTKLNRIRREHPALQEYDNLRFYDSDDDNLLSYGKATADRSDFVLVVVNLDPFAPREGHIHLPIDQWGIGWDEPYRIRDLTFDETHLWTGGRIWLRLDPQESPYRIYSIERWRPVQFAEPCG
jgi:starch synthase (maltosyl-transferring)